MNRWRRGECARILNKGGKRTQDLTQDLARELDYARAVNRPHPRAHTLAVDLARNLAHAIDLARDAERAIDLARALTRAHDCDRDLALAINGADALVRALCDAISRATVSGRALDRAGASALDRSYARAIDRTLSKAYTILNSVILAGAFAQGATAAPAAAEGQVRVTGPARRLTTVAAWLAPAASRARYEEEYYSELQDLASAGAGRYRQVLHATRVLRCAVPLRMEALATRRPKVPQ
jgi:hypothetical protein